MLMAPLCSPWKKNLVRILLKAQCILVVGFVQFSESVWANPPQCDLATERQYTVTFRRFCGGAPTDSSTMIGGSRPIGPTANVRVRPDFQSDSDALRTREMARQDQHINPIMTRTTAGVPQDAAAVRRAMTESAAIERSAAATCRRVLDRFAAECGRGQTNAAIVAERQYRDRLKAAEGFDSTAADAEQTFASAVNNGRFDPNTPTTSWGRAASDAVGVFGRYNPIALAATGLGYSWPKDWQQGVGGYFRRDLGLAMFREGSNLPGQTAAELAMSSGERNAREDDVVPLETAPLSRKPAAVMSGEVSIKQAVPGLKDVEQ